MQLKANYKYSVELKKMECKNCMWDFTIQKTEVIKLSKGDFVCQDEELTATLDCLTDHLKLTSLPKELNCSTHYFAAYGLKNHNLPPCQTFNDRLVIS